MTNTTTPIAGGATGIEPAADGTTPGVLCIHTATEPPLGADTWVHSQIIAGLDPTAHRVHVAYVTERDGAPTPTADVLDAVGGIRKVSVNFGRENIGVDGFKGTLARAADGVRALNSFARLLVTIRRNKISIIHTSDRPRDALFSVMLAKLTGATSIVQVHVLFRPWMGKALQWAIRNADVRIAVSAFVDESLTDSGVTGETHVVLNAIDCSRWTPGEGRDDARTELGLAEDAPVALTTCRLFPEKGVAELIAAMVDVRRAVPDAVLVIVGQDRDPSQAFRKKLDALVEEHDLGEAVIFAGLRSDVPRMMAAADVFAMPSFEEPFGLVFAEAMAMELPVVALDNGGTKEVVVHGQHGFLSEPGDHEKLVKHLVTLLGDPELRAQFGTAGRAHTLANFDTPRMAADVAAIYQQLPSR